MAVGERASGFERGGGPDDATQASEITDFEPHRPASTYQRDILHKFQGRKARTAGGVAVATSVVGHLRCFSKNQKTAAAAEMG